MLLQENMRLIYDIPLLVSLKIHQSKTGLMGRNGIETGFGLSKYR